MTFLPIVERELRVRARLKSTYRFRLVAAVVAILIVSVLLAMSEGVPGVGQYGKLVFTVLACLSFLYCLFDGARNTADSLSQEKRAGTLGLLFLTDLRPYDVVLGKLMASSLNSFYGLLAIFPPLAIPLVVGGVTVGEFWRLVLVLLNTLFFSVAAGMCVSAVCRDERRAWMSSTGILLFFAILPPLLLQVPALGSTFLATTSPTTALMLVEDGAYGVSAGQYWSSIRNVQCLGWLLLGAAMFILPRTWQDRSEKPTDNHSWWARFSRRVAQHSVPDDFAGRAAVLDENPAVWLVSRAGLRQVLLGVLFLGAGLALTAVWVLASNSAAAGWTIAGVMFLVHFVLSVCVAVEACHLFAGARDTGVMELLLCTPLTAKDVVEGHVEGLRKLFVRPVVALLAIEGVLLGGQVYLLAGDGTSLAVCTLIVLAAGLCMLAAVMDLVAVARYGLWQGLIQRRPARAVTRTILWVLLVPILPAVCTGGLLLPVLWPLKNLVFISYAREQLRRQFRGALTERCGWADESELVGAVPQDKRGWRTRV